jgi:hypothetical protein
MAYSGQPRITQVTKKGNTSTYKVEWAKELTSAQSDTILESGWKFEWNMRSLYTAITRGQKFAEDDRMFISDIAILPHESYTLPSRSERYLFLTDDSVGSTINAAVWQKSADAPLTLLNRMVCILSPTGKPIVADPTTHIRLRVPDEKVLEIAMKTWRAWDPITSNPLTVDGAESYIYETIDGAPNPLYALAMGDTNRHHLTNPSGKEHGLVPCAKEAFLTGFSEEKKCKMVNVPVETGRSLLEFSEKTRESNSMYSAIKFMLWAPERHSPAPHPESDKHVVLSFHVTCITCKKDAVQSFTERESSSELNLHLLTDLTETTPDADDMCGSRPPAFRANVTIPSHVLISAIRETGNVPATALPVIQSIACMPQACAFTDLHSFATSLDDTLVHMHDATLKWRALTAQGGDAKGLDLAMLGTAIADMYPRIGGAVEGVKSVLFPPHVHVTMQEVHMQSATISNPCEDVGEGGQTTSSWEKATTVWSYVFQPGTQQTKTEEEDAVVYAGQPKELHANIRTLLKDSPYLLRDIAKQGSPKGDEVVWVQGQVPTTLWNIVDTINDYVQENKDLPDLAKAVSGSSEKGVARRVFAFTRKLKDDVKFLEGFFPLSSPAWYAMTKRSSTITFSNEACKNLIDFLKTFMEGGFLTSDLGITVALVDGAGSLYMDRSARLAFQLKYQPVAL